jgi:hypothetical protein
MTLIPLAIFQAWVSAGPELTKHRPTTSIFYWPVLLSIGVAILVNSGFLFFFFENVRQ